MNWYEWSGKNRRARLKGKSFQSDPFEDKSPSKESCAFYGIIASWMTWCKCRCMAVEAREKGCVYSTQEINRRIIIRLGRGGMSRCASILIDTLFSCFTRETSGERSVAYRSLGEAQKKIIPCAWLFMRDYGNW